LRRPVTWPDLVGSSGFRGPRKGPRHGLERPEPELRPQARRWFGRVRRVRVRNRPVERSVLAGHRSRFLPPSGPAAPVRTTAALAGEARVRPLQGQKQSLKPGDSAADTRVLGFGAFRGRRITGTGLRGLRPAWRPRLRVALAAGRSGACRTRSSP